uniref:Uncharacterized protein n=1 Tax=Salix viminalis TaxID=40686 RepID=A0A6N2N4J1_SALVM
MEWRIGGTSIHWPSFRSCRPLTVSSWKSKMMPPASVWALRPFTRSGSSAMFDSGRCRRKKSSPPQCPEIHGLCHGSTAKNVQGKEYKRWG